MANSDRTNAEVVLNADSMRLIVVRRRETEAEWITIRDRCARSNSDDVVLVIGPFKTVLQVVFTERILEARAEFVTVTILV